MNISMKKSSGKSCYILNGFILIFVMVFAAGCGKIFIHFSQPLFDDLSGSFMRQRDVVLAEQGIPAYLLFLDGLIEHSPRNKSLLLTGASAYSAYTSAFVGEKYPDRNKILAAKAKDYAFRALSLQNRKFARMKNEPYSEFAATLPSFRKRDVPYLYYAATTWAGWIQANSESSDALADLPKVKSLIERIIELNESFNYGAPHTFMGIMLVIYPPSLGGKPDEAMEHFERAIELGQGKFLPTYVMYDHYYAKLVYEKELFYDLLYRVLASPVDAVPEITLINSLAQKQARDLIDEARKEEYFD
jgi:tetratricopeptide (TPR) repeat protein